MSGQNINLSSPGGIAGCHEPSCVPRKSIVTLKQGLDNSWKLKHQSSALLALCEGNPPVTNVALCEEKPPVTGGFPSQRASNAESISMAWHHIMGNLIHGKTIFAVLPPPPLPPSPSHPPSGRFPHLYIPILQVSHLHLFLNHSALVLSVPAWTHKQHPWGQSGAMEY